MKNQLFIVLILLTVFIFTSKAQNFESKYTKSEIAQPSFVQVTNGSSLIEMKQRWAEINYQLKGGEQERAFQLLLQKAGKNVQLHPKSAEHWVMLGIIQSSFANATGGLSALSFVKDARSSFERGMKINDKVMEGSAYASLGILYLKIPGWPISFGDDDKAKELLDKALEISSNSIDANFFMAEYFYDHRKYKQTKRYLLNAQQGEHRSDWALADTLRQQEINTLLVKVNKKLKR